MKLIQFFRRKKKAAPIVQSIPERFPNGMPQDLALVRLRPDDFSERFGLTFEEDDEDDGLGPFRYCAIKVEGVGQVVLQWHEWAGVPGTQILVDSRQDFRRTLKILTVQLQLEPDDIEWTILEAENGADSEAAS